MSLDGLWTGAATQEDRRDEAEPATSVGLASW